MASSSASSMIRHDDLVRAVRAAGHAFAPVDEGQEVGPKAPSPVLALSAVSLAGFVASCGMFLVFV